MKCSIRQWSIKAPWGRIAIRSLSTTPTRNRSPTDDRAELRHSSSDPTMNSSGDRDGQPVLLVHGRQDCSETFTPLLEFLPDTDYYYVAMDMPGSSTSDPFPTGKPPDPSQERLRNLASILESYQQDEASKTVDICDCMQGTIHVVKEHMKLKITPTAEETEEITKRFVHEQIAHIMADMATQVARDARTNTSLAHSSNTTPGQDTDYVVIQMDAEDGVLYPDIVESSDNSTVDEDRHSNMSVDVDGNDNLPPHINPNANLIIHDDNFSDITSESPRTVGVTDSDDDNWTDITNDFIDPTILGRLKSGDEMMHGNNGNVYKVLLYDEVSKGYWVVPLAKAGKCECNHKRYKIAVHNTVKMEKDDIPDTTSDTDDGFGFVDQFEEALSRLDRNTPQDEHPESAPGVSEEPIRCNEHGERRCPFETQEAELLRSEAAKTPPKEKNPNAKRKPVPAAPELKPRHDVAVPLEVAVELTPEFPRLRGYNIRRLAQALYKFGFVTRSACVHESKASQTDISNQNCLIVIGTDDEGIHHCPHMPTGFIDWIHTYFLNEGYNDEQQDSQDNPAQISGEQELSNGPPDHHDDIPERNQVDQHPTNALQITQGQNLLPIQDAEQRPNVPKNSQPQSSEAECERHTAPLVQPHVTQPTAEGELQRGNELPVNTYQIGLPAQEERERPAAPQNTPDDVQTSTSSDEQYQCDSPLVNPYHIPISIQDDQQRAQQEFFNIVLENTNGQRSFAPLNHPYHIHMLSPVEQQNPSQPPQQNNQSSLQVDEMPSLLRDSLRQAEPAVQGVLRQINTRPSHHDEEVPGQHRNTMPILLGYPTSSQGGQEPPNVLRPSLRSFNIGQDDHGPSNEHQNGQSNLNIQIPARGGQERPTAPQDRHVHFQLPPQGAHERVNAPLDRHVQFQLPPQDTQQRLNPRDLLLQCQIPVPDGQQRYNPPDPQLQLQAPFPGPQQRPFVPQDRRFNFLPPIPGVQQVRPHAPQTLRGYNQMPGQGGPNIQNIRWCLQRMQTQSYDAQLRAEYMRNVNGAQDIGIPSPVAGAFPNYDYLLQPNHNGNRNPTRSFAASNVSPFVAVSDQITSLISPTAIRTSVKPHTPPYIRNGDLAHPDHRFAAPKPNVALRLKPPNGAPKPDIVPNTTLLNDIGNPNAANTSSMMRDQATTSDPSMNTEMSFRPTGASNPCPLGSNDLTSTYSGNYGYNEPITTYPVFGYTDMTGHYRTYGYNDPMSAYPIFGYNDPITGYPTYGYPIMGYPIYGYNPTMGYPTFGFNGMLGYPAMGPNGLMSTYPTLEAMRNAYLAASNGVTGNYRRFGSNVISITQASNTIAFTDSRVDPNVLRSYQAMWLNGLQYAQPEMPPNSTLGAYPEYGSGAPMAEQAVSASNPMAYQPRPNADMVPPAASYAMRSSQLAAPSNAAADLYGMAYPQQPQIQPRRSAFARYPQMIPERPQEPTPRNEHGNYHPQPARPFGVPPHHVWQPLGSPGIVDTGAQGSEPRVRTSRYAGLSTRPGPSPMRTESPQSAIPSPYWHEETDYIPSYFSDENMVRGVKIMRFHFLAALEVVIEHLGWDKFIFIGHSMGCELGLFYNAIYPGKVTKMILLDAEPTLRRLQVQDLAEYQAMFYDDYYNNYMKDNLQYRTYTILQAKQALMKSRNLSEKAASLIVSKSLIHVAGDQYRFTWDRRLKLPAAQNYPNSYYFELFKNVPPTLLISATQIFNPNSKYKEGSFELVKKLCTLKNFKQVMVEGDHDVHLSHPERVAPYVKEFLIKNVVLPSKL